MYIVGDDLTETLGSGFHTAKKWQELESTDRDQISDGRRGELGSVNEWQTRKGPECGLCLVMHEKLNERAR